MQPNYRAGYATCLGRVFPHYSSSLKLLQVFLELYGSHIINVLYLFHNITKKRFVVDSIYLQILIT